jgi:hypothetical protein
VRKWIGKIETLPGTKVAYCIVFDDRKKLAKRVAADRLLKRVFWTFIMPRLKRRSICRITRDYLRALPGFTDTGPTSMR